MSVLVLVYRHALALHDLNEICTPRGKRAVSQKLQSCLTRLRHNVSLDMYDMTVQMCEVTLKAKECLAQYQPPISLGRHGRRRTSSTPIVSFQYSEDSFLRHEPLSFRVLIRRTISPGSQSGLSSASPSRTVSQPSGAPCGTSMAYTCVCSSTFAPLQCGHARVTTLPRPPHREHVTCDCEYIPGMICWRTTCTPAPLHAGQVCTSAEDAAPLPRQWSQRMRLRTGS